MYILTGIVITLLGIILLFKEKRSFFNGTLFSFGILVLFASLLFELFNILYNLSPEYSSIVNLISFLIILSLILAFVIFIIYVLKKYLKYENIDRVIVIFLFSIFNFILSLAGILYFFIMGMTLKNKIVTEILIIISFIDFIFCMLFILYLIYSLFYQFVPIKNKVSYIIVLGSGIKSLEVPPLLKSRLDKGIEIYKSFDKKPIFIVSGGQGEDEPYSEAYVMANYLHSQNIPRDQVILEDQSTTTYENMLNSSKIIKSNSAKNSNENIIVFTTNNYHVLRASIYAKKAGLSAEGQGAPTALYFLPSALFREFIALLVMHKKSFSLFILIILSIFIFIMY